ncbi:MAG: FTR1 family iron permease [Bifidobacteriaceae bacterium]|jgi:high-affinity iron transporter|nr:FTR1 family iron permease [Bifidobacteriaceae bacterium]
MRRLARGATLAAAVVTALLPLAAAAATAAIAVTCLVAAPAHAAEATGETWGDIAQEMSAILDEAYATYQGGDATAAKDQVDNAYYGYYEKLGFEKVVMAHVSGAAATDAEYEFGLIKKGMLAGDPEAEVREHIDILAAMLADQAQRLDGDSDSPIAALGKSLIIILREGFEAILVVGAIVAYLVKSGNRDKLRTVYAGAGVALLASIALAVAINALSALAGANQEIIEGVTVLIAVAMLIWVSNWIASKVDAAAWTGYIRAQTRASLGGGSAFSLAFVAFLAVFREGAETILFYQALRTQAGGQGAMLWLGLGIGIVALIGVYLAIRFLAIRIPTGPFFITTSALLAVMAVAFAGSGIKELQEGGVVSITPIDAVPSVDLLGIYPSAETLAAQAVVMILVITGFVLGLRTSRRARGAMDTTTSHLSPDTPLETAS